MNTTKRNPYAGRRTEQGTCDACSGRWTAEVVDLGRYVRVVGVPGEVRRLCADHARYVGLVFRAGRAEVAVERPASCRSCGHAYHRGPCSTMCRTCETEETR